jgi:hypothetical protein
MIFICALMLLQNIQAKVELRAESVPEGSSVEN